MGSYLNPLPIGPEWIDPKTGQPTQEFFWFINQLLQGALNVFSTESSGAFAPPSQSAASDPVVRAIQKAIAFQKPHVDQSALAALQKIATFGAQVSSALQRITDLERLLAFRSQPPGPNTPQIIICTQATFPNLNAANKNSFIYVTDYFHFIFWDGTAPAFADGGSNYYAVAALNPATGGAVAGGGWHPVDGTANVPYLKADGTLGSKTLVNVAGTPAYLRVGSGTDTLNAPVAPGLTMNSYTPAGSVSTPVFTGSTFTPAGSVSSGFTGTPQTFSTSAATSTGAVNAFTAPNPYTPDGSVSSTFTGSGGTPAGSISTPVFTGTPAVLTGTIDTTGAPESFYSKLWFRM